MFDSHKMPHLREPKVTSTLRSPYGRVGKMHQSRIFNILVSTSFNENKILAKISEFTVTLFIPMNFPLHIDTISMSQVERISSDKASNLPNETFVLFC